MHEGRIIINSEIPWSEDPRLLWGTAVVALLMFALVSAWGYQLLKYACQYSGSYRLNMGNDVIVVIYNTSTAC